MVFHIVDGQKIAKKLSQQITKEMKALRKLVEEYNSCGDQYTSELTFSDALDPVVIATRLENVGITTSGILGKRRELIDSYLLLCRSKEELALLEEDINCSVMYYRERQSTITREIESAEGLDLYIQGKRALLHNLLEENRLLLQKSEHVQFVMKQGSTEAPEATCVFSDSETDSD